MVAVRKQLVQTEKDSCSPENIRNILIDPGNATVPLAGDAHDARTAYVKMNRYALRSLRWFGGTFPALLFLMRCVSAAYQWHMGDAHAAHMAYEWRCHCLWCRVWDPDHCVTTVQVAYAQQTFHVRTTMAGEPINTPHHICELLMWHLNVQLNTYVSKCPV